MMAHHGPSRDAQVKVERIENPMLWKQYWHRKREIADVYKTHHGRSACRPLNPAATPLGPSSVLDPDRSVDHPQICTDLHEAERWACGWGAGCWTTR